MTDDPKCASSRSRTKGTSPAHWRNGASPRTTFRPGPGTVRGPARPHREPSLDDPACSAPARDETCLGGLELPPLPQRPWLPWLRLINAKNQALLQRPEQSPFPSSASLDREAAARAR